MMMATAPIMAYFASIFVTTVVLSKQCIRKSPPWMINNECETGYNS
jgi:hypothetical protein